MQHGRASSVIATRSFVGYSRIIGLLIALFLFVGTGLVTPDFTACTDDIIPHYTLRAGDDIQVNIANNADFMAEFAGTGYQGLILDHEGVTPPTRPTFKRDSETVTPSALGLQTVQSLKDSYICAPVPDGANNVEGIKWLSEEIHTITIVFYHNDSLSVGSNPIYDTMNVYTSYMNNIDDPTLAPAVDPVTSLARTDGPTAEPAPTADLEPAPTSRLNTDPAPASAPDPVVEPTTEPPVAPVSLPDDPQLPTVRLGSTPSGSASLTPTPSAPATASRPSETPASPISDVSQLNDSNKGGVNAVSTTSLLAINTPSDKTAANDWTSANIMQTGEACWLQVEDSNRVTMDLAGLPTDEYKVVVTGRSHKFVGWAELRVTSAVGAATNDSSVDASGAVKLHAEILSSSFAGDESGGFSEHLLDVGACILILSDLVVAQVFSGPRIGSSLSGVTLS